MPLFRARRHSRPGPRLLVGCCAYSYRQYLEKKQMTMEDFILKAVELGIQGVDITTYWLTSTEPGYLAGLRHLAYVNGVPFSGAAIRTNMCQPDAAKRREELENIRRWVDATECLGAAHVRVFGGDLPPGASDEQGIQWVVETMKPACDYAAGKGIILGIESHGGITSKAANILEILRRVDSPVRRVQPGHQQFSGESVSADRSLPSRAPRTRTSVTSTETRKSPWTWNVSGRCSPKPGTRVTCRPNTRAMKIRCLACRNSSRE